MRAPVPKLRPYNKGIFGSTLVLMGVGLVMISSASAVLSFQRFQNTNYFFLRQLLFISIGVLLMIIFSRIDYRLYKKYAVMILLLALLLLAIVLIPGVSCANCSSTRWIDLKIFFFQPSEFAKLAVIFFMAAWFDSRSDRVKSFYYGLLPPLASLAVVSALVLLEPDFGGMSAIVLIAFSIFYAAGARLTHLAALLGSGITMAYLAVLAAPYRLARITSFLNPEADPLGTGYQINQAILAIGSGGFWGQGFGYSRQKFNFLPEPIGDSIFAVIGEELGFLRVAIILAIFLFFILLGYRVASRAPDNYGKLVAVGITSWIMIQVVFNVGAMVGFLPLTGIPLPFISYGGSSILASSIGVGVLLSISRWK